MNLIITAVAAAAVAAGLYARSLVIRPWRPCKPCAGTGKDCDPIWTRAFGECPACGGTGKVPRLGVRLFQQARYARLRKRGRQS